MIDSQGGGKESRAEQSRRGDDAVPSCKAVAVWSPVCTVFSRGNRERRGARSGEGEGERRREHERQKRGVQKDWRRGVQAKYLMRASAQAGIDATTGAAPPRGLCLAWIGQ